MNRGFLKPWVTFAVAGLFYVLALSTRGIDTRFVPEWVLVTVICALASGAIVQCLSFIFRGAGVPLAGGTGAEDSEGLGLFKAVLAAHSAWLMFVLFFAAMGYRYERSLSSGLDDLALGWRLPILIALIGLGVALIAAPFCAGYSIAVLLHVVLVEEAGFPVWLTAPLYVAIGLVWAVATTFLQISTIAFVATGEWMWIA